MRLSHLSRTAAALAAAATLAAPAALSSTAQASSSHPEGMHVFRTKAARPVAGASTNNDLYYHGGIGGVGVETGVDKVYLVEWGFNGSDPSGEVGIQTRFFSGVGGSSWNNSVTQYCQGVGSGTYFCGTSGTHATNPSGMYGGIMVDNSNPLPRRLSQSAIAAEAARAAQYFGNTSASSNTTAQYVIDSPHGHSMSGFGTQWCAWHSSTSSSYGNVAYTYFPYITDAGGSCGANIISSSTDGITIVGGHELAETESDIFPNGGWLDASGAENGDKCAWITSGQGAIAQVSFSTGTFPVQSLWSNAFNGGAGGCVQSY